MNYDTELQQNEQRLLMLRGELIQAKQAVKSINVQALQTEGRILLLRELKAKAAASPAGTGE